MVIVIVGAEAAGRIAIARALATELGWPFVDAETAHPPSSAGPRPSALLPPASAGRTAWAAAVHAIIARTIERRERLVIACASVAPGERAILKAELKRVRFVYLDRGARAAGPPPGLSEVLSFDAAAPLSEVLPVIRREFGLANHPSAPGAPGVRA
jgi:hypothetical protein